MPFPDRRTFLRQSAGLAAALVAAPAAANKPAFKVHAWERDKRNPILPPSPKGGEKGFDVGCCMNPFVLRRDDEYWLFYAGADAQGRRRICLATAPVEKLTEWKRHGPLFDLGGKGAFDEVWCVL